MIRWLCDTNVISETRRPKPSSKVTAWLGGLDLDQIFTSAVVIAELRHGALTCRDQMRQVEITQWIEESVRPWLRGRIFPVDETVLLNWLIMAKRQQLARAEAPPVDLLIAAAARTHECHVATRDVAPFVMCGLPVLNPWTGERFNGA